MTIHRIPVIDVRGPGTGPAPIIHALQCTGAECASQRAAHLAAHQTGEASFTCPNFRANDPSKCAKTCFLYPRLVRGGSWHFHQGIDVGGREGVSNILSVTDGVVHFARNGPLPAGYTGYGKVVVVHSDPFYYLYAHCAEVRVQTGDPVRQQQIIATVGRTQYLGDGREHSDTMGPHLHFEVSNARYPVASGETSLDNPSAGARIDPRAHLESLGPWGPKKFYFPLISANGGGDAEANEISVESTQRMFDATERDNIGGYFPLGANNIWHGGVHLRAEANALVRAPFDAKVVAVRLDPDPARARGLFGSLNFVLLHHELPEPIAARMSDGRPPEREPWRGAVGLYRGRTRRRNEVANAPELVREIKQLLHQTGFYAPAESALVDDGTAVDDAFIAAIVTFQSNYSRHPDGVVDVPGTTYAHLRECVDAIERRREHDAAVARGEPPPRPRMVYTLLMHLRPEPLDDALVGRIPWLGRIELEPNDAERQREASERAQREARREREVAEDGLDRTYALGGSVGPPARRRGPANDAADIAWVQRRLTRHGLYEGEADGQWSASVDAAVRSFQTEHVPWYRNHRVDASISASGMTQQRLAVTPAELEITEYDPDAAQPGSLDRRFIGRATELDNETGIAKTVTGLDVAIFGGEPVWTAGVGLGFAAPAGSDDARGIASRGTDDAATGPLIHWEIFSEQALIGAWEQLDDDRDDDLAVDVPALINQAQASSTGEPPPFDEAYDPPEADPEADPAHEARDEGEALAEDGVLSVAEIRAFYASDRCHALRNTQVRFHSEWALNLSNTVDALRELGWNTRGLAAALAPYMWWSKVGDAVPSSPLVWHCNPIAFMDHYRQLFPQPPPPAPTPAPEPSTGTEADRCDEAERLRCE